MILQPGDIVVSSSPSWLPRAIRFFTRSIGEPPSRVSHCAIVSGWGRVGEVCVIEAVARGVVERPLHFGARDWYAVYRDVYSDIGHTPSGRMLEAVTRARGMVGTEYPMYRLAAHLLDWLLGGVRWFRRVSRSQREMECSALVAWALEIGDWWMWTPDDLDDLMRSVQTWKTVRELAAAEGE